MNHLTVPMRHWRRRGCAFCTELRRIDEAYDGDLQGEWDAVDELFDRAERASRAHALYGRRKGHR